MLRGVKRALVATVIVVAVGAVLWWLTFSPAVPFSWEPAVPPGRITYSQPDGKGVVTAIRPLITQIAPSEPLGLAIHWQRKEGAFREDDPFVRQRDPNVNRVDTYYLRRKATLNSMVFTFTAPDGTMSKKRVRFNEDRQGEGVSVYKIPTIIIKVEGSGVSLIAPVDQLYPSTHRKAEWLDNSYLDISQPGIHTVQISGSISREAHPLLNIIADEFATETVSFEVTHDVKPEDSLATRAKLFGKVRFGRPGLKGPGFAADDGVGNRHFGFSDKGGGLYEYWAGKIVVRPDGAVVSTDQRIEFSCVAAGTLVQTPRGAQGVETLRPGDYVHGFDFDTSEVVPTVVQRVHRSNVESTIVVNGALRVTAEHPVWANDSWMRADQLSIGDVLCSAGDTAMVVSTLERLAGEIEVVDLQVDSPNNFFAGGILVHNKKIEVTPGLLDPWYALPGAPPP